MSEYSSIEQFASPRTNAQIVEIKKVGNNVAYVIKRIYNSHYCGYVIFPEKHDRRDFEYEIRVHGGVTFDDYIEGGLRVYGFDCAHAQDFKYPKDLKYVRKEIKGMFHQINLVKRGGKLE